MWFAITFKAAQEKNSFKMARFKSPNTDHHNGNSNQIVSIKDQYLNL